MLKEVQPTEKLSHHSWQQSANSPSGRLYWKFCFSMDKQKTTTSLSTKRKESCSSGRRCGSDLERVFGFFDKDGDGVISSAELRSCMRTMGEEWSEDQAASAIRFLDSDGDGCVGLADFVILMGWEKGDHKGKRREMEQEEDTIKAAFGMYAADGTECITPTSLRRMLKRLGDSKTMKECRAMIRCFDTNGDGVLSFEEFKHMMM